MEGIGSSRDYWYYSDIRPIWVHNYFIMAECYDNGKLVFTQEDFHKESLPTGITQAKGAKTNGGQMYNLLGQRINTPKKGEIYVQNGKKRIAR